MGNAAKMPEGYDVYALCKLFGCLPSQLEQEDADDIELMLAFYNAETQHRNAIEKMNAERSAAKKK